MYNFLFVVIYENFLTMYIQYFTFENYIQNKCKNKTNKYYNKNVDIVLDM